MSRACIPFHILFDKDLSKNELIIYGLVEHMESNGRNVFFNNRTIAEKLGVSHESRIVGKMLSNLKKKGYIGREHKEITFRDKQGTERKVMRWCLSTVKSVVIFNESDDENMVPEIPPITVVPEIPPTVVSEIPPYNTPDPTYPLTTTPVIGGGSFTPFEIQALDHKHPSDDRTPDEYLKNVHHHIEHGIKDKPLLMKQSMTLSLLKKVYDNGGRFESVGFVSNETKQETKMKKKHQEDNLLWSQYQNYLKSPVEIDLRTRGVVQELSFEEWKSKRA